MSGSSDKRRAIRSALGRLGMQAGAGEVVAELARLGISVSEALVSRVKLDMLRASARADAVRQRQRKPPAPPPTYRPQKRPPRR
jgi:hypothetical protein